MQDIVLYCKSYKQDVKRVVRLARSVTQFNEDSIPFYISVPDADFSLFEEHLKGYPILLLRDEDIVRSSPRLDQQKMDSIVGGLSQQIVKAEFWRLRLSDAYLCIDSDCQFIRGFRRDDFINQEGYPYTVMHEAKELLQFAVNHGLKNVFEMYRRERQKIMGLFERTGPFYDFGPPPMIWGADVWRALDEQFLKPRNMSFYDAILQFPAEILWYGEAMLKYRPYPILPVEPLFKFYHYESQYNFGLKEGESDAKLALNFLGVCRQSNWEKEIDFEPKKRSAMSTLARTLRLKVFRRAS